MDSYVIRKERCPKCAKDGRDRTGDNLAVYSDGHTYCFSCGWTTGGTRIVSPDGTNVPVELTLPSDSCYDYPKEALAWCEQYGIPSNTLLEYRVVWSDYFSRLIFPVFDSTGLIAFQGRYFGPEKQVKWWGRGDLKNVLNILKGTNNSAIILCEDILSAIKINKAGFTSMPLYGSHISKQRFERIKNFYTSVIVWLDPDKRAASIKFMRLGNSMGLSVSTVFSEHDPKEMSIEGIKEKLNEHS